MVPPAPGRFSTISGWPLANCAKPFDRLRDSVSAAPPAPTGTSSRTGRSGHCAACWASAGAATDAAPAAAAILMMSRRVTLVNGMASPRMVSSFELDIRRFHHLGPLLHLGAQIGVELGGPLVHRLGALLLPGRLHVRPVGQCLEL